MTNPLPPLHDIMDPGWAAALAPVEPQVRELGNMLRAETRAGRAYLPQANSIMRAFTYPFEDVKVLIVGQDPYPTPGHSTGLAFSVSPETPLPASLRNIYRELESDLGVPAPPNGDLSGWARQGVCLLNRVLTVTPRAPKSHRGRGWERVTDQAVRALTERDRPLVAVLWGRDAQELRTLLSKVPLVESAHPSPLSAHRGFFGSNPFSQVNRLLVDQGATPVDWSA